MSQVPTVFLVDNGSLRPAATLGLRRLAQRLSDTMGLAVEAVSLLHSHKIDPADLGGVPATIVRRRLRECSEQGQRAFVLLPLFLGPSSAISDYLPQLIAEARERQPDLQVVVADPLVGAEAAEPDIRLAQILAEHVRAVLRERQWAQPQVALVDHGTPIRRVNQVRDAVAAQLAQLLATEAVSVRACSMERREGVEYDFNEPLLERVGDPSAGFAGGNLIVAMFFLLPGRHAGAGGDVTEICDGLQQAGQFEQVATTPLLAEHPQLLDILQARLQAVL